MFSFFSNSFITRCQFGQPTRFLRLLDQAQHVKGIKAIGNQVTSLKVKLHLIHLYCFFQENKTDQVLAHNYYPKYLWQNGIKQFLDNGNGKQNDYKNNGDYYWKKQPTSIFIKRWLLEVLAFHHDKSLPPHSLLTNIDLLGHILCHPTLLFWRRPPQIESVLCCLINLKQRPMRFVLAPTIV